MTNGKTSLALLASCLVWACVPYGRSGGGLKPAPLPSYGESALTLSAPGIAWEQPETLRVAARLQNPGREAATDVQIASLRLASAALLTPVPMTVGEIGAEQSAIVQASFKSGPLSPGQEYQLTIDGSYRTAGAAERQRFATTVTVVVPRTAPGSAPVRVVIVRPNKVTGAPYRPQSPRGFKEANQSRWTVPTGPFVPGERTQSSTGTQKAPMGDPPAIVFEVNNGIGITNGSSIAEPSGGATGGDIVFVTSNWFAAYSTDGGNVFTQLNPTTIFPADAIGYCCDQIVQYVPSIDRFIWLLQGNNGYRLAAASPADIRNSGGTSWVYWNLPSDIFSQPTGTGVDYPDLSVGNNALYMSWDVGWPSCPTGCRSGFQVSRTSLAGIQAAGTISIDYTNPPDAPMAWGGHLTQNTLDEIFWAGHNSSSQVRVFSLQEGSNTYFWRDVGVSTWANNALSSTTPDGQNWLAGSGGFPGNAVLGSTRVGPQVWFAWSAGTDNSFRQPHVEIVVLDRDHGFSRLQQVQIWNDAYAFAYPALAANRCTGEVGMSFEYGGSNDYENHVVGFWGDFIAYITTGSNVGTTRFGDYVTIRQQPPNANNRGSLFAAFGYGLNSVPPPGTGTRTDIHYVVFGRPASTCQPR